jgi:hypothetical protein
LGGGVVVAYELVDVIRRDLREVVDHEVKMFLENYVGCEVVEAIYNCCSGMFVRREAVMDGLPCEITTFFVFAFGGVIEVPSVRCKVMFEEDVLASIDVLWLPHKCFAKVFVNEERIKEIARNIARKMIRDVERGSGGDV